MDTIVKYSVILTKLLMVAASLVHLYHVYIESVQSYQYGKDRRCVVWTNPQLNQPHPNIFIIAAWVLFLVIHF